jgi:hypothetical protein
MNQEYTNLPGMVIHGYNPRYLGGGDRRMAVEGKLGQMHETLSEKAN